jgi:hypothetical protein
MQKLALEISNLSVKNMVVQLFYVGISMRYFWKLTVFVCQK